MKKIVAILLSLLLGTSLNTNAQSADKAADQVAALSRAVKALGGYEVRFTVAVGEHKMSGRYMVGDDRYALSLGNVEAYGDRECRYEVDTSRKEVVVDRVDNTSHNLLSNPLSAFDFIGDEYRAELLSEHAGKVVVRLTPHQNPEQSGVIEVAIDSKTDLPKSIVYRPSGESIRVDIDHIGTTSARPQKYDHAKFKDFEVIDFR